MTVDTGHAPAPLRLPRAASDASPSSPRRRSPWSPTAVHVPALAAANGPAKVTDTPSSSHKVTLVTGDVVTRHDAGRREADRRRRRPVDAVGGVRMQERQGDLYVVPDEAVGLLGTDKLDPRLFDVTDLIEMGYDDAGTGTVPMIATFTRAATAVAAAPRAPQGSTVVRRLPAVHSAALTAPKPGSARSGTPSRRPSTCATPPPPCGPASPSCGSTAGEGQPQRERARRSARPRPGPPGTTARASRSPCSTPASTSNHPDLAAQVDEHRTASSRTRAIADVNGHGTHVASTIVGTGAASGRRLQGRRPGRRPDRRQGARRPRGLRPGLLGHGRHGVGRRPGRQGRQHEPRRLQLRVRRHRPDGAGGRRALRPVRHALRDRGRQRRPARPSRPRARPPRR